MDFLLSMLLYFPNIIFGGLGLYMIIYGIRNIRKIYSCKEIIDGWCAEKGQTWKFRRYEKYYVFNYRYEGKDYYSKSKYGLTNELYEYVRQGEKYTIYVNSKKPEIFVVERKITSAEIFTIGLGLFLLGAAIVMYIKDIL